MANSLRKLALLISGVLFPIVFFFSVTASINCSPPDPQPPTPTPTNTPVVGPPPPPNNPPAPQFVPACGVDLGTTLNDSLSGHVDGFVAMDLYARSYSPVGARLQGTEFMATIFTDADFSQNGTDPVYGWIPRERLDLTTPGESFAMSANNRRENGLVALYKQNSTTGPLIAGTWKRTGVNSDGTSIGTQADLPLGSHIGCFPTTSTDSEAVFGACYDQNVSLKYPKPQIMTRPGEIYPTTGALDSTVNLYDGTSDNIVQYLNTYHPVPVRWSDATATATLTTLNTPAGHQYGVVTDANDGRFFNTQYVSAEDAQFVSEQKPTIVVGYGLKTATQEVRPYMWSIHPTSGVVTFVDLYDANGLINVQNINILPPGLDFSMPHDTVLLGSNSAGIVIGYIQFRGVHNGITNERVAFRVDYLPLDNGNNVVEPDEIQIYILDSLLPDQSGYNARNFILTSLPPSYGWRAGGMTFTNSGLGNVPVGYADGEGIYSIPNTSGSGPGLVTAKGVAAVQDNGALVANAKTPNGTPMAIVHRLSTLQVVEINPGNIPNIEEPTGDMRALGFYLGADGTVLAPFGSETWAFVPQDGDPTQMQAINLTDGGLASSFGGARGVDQTNYYTVMSVLNPVARKSSGGAVSSLTSLDALVATPSISKSVIYGAGDVAGDIAGMVHNGRWRAFASSASTARVLSDPTVTGGRQVIESAAFARLSGIVVGYSKVKGPNTLDPSYEIATAWDPSTGTGTLLGALSGDVRSSAVAISSYGGVPVIGGWSAASEDDGGQKRGFVADPSMRVYGSLKHISITGQTLELPSTEVTGIDNNVKVGYVQSVEPGQFKQLASRDVAFISSAQDPDALVDLNTKIEPGLHYHILKALAYRDSKSAILAVAEKSWLDSNHTVQIQPRLILITATSGAADNNLCAPRS